MPLEHWFATPIYFDKASNFEDIQTEIQNCYSQIDLGKHDGWGEQNHSLSSPYFTEHLIKQYNLEVLEKEIRDQVKKYTNIFSDAEFDIEIEDSWLTNTAPKEHTVVHNHGDTTISGVYYYKTNGKDGNIYFLNPNTSLMASYFLKPDDYVEYPPQEGLFILFPGWLHHGVRSNDTNDERISISFNIRLKKINRTEDA